jgi:hypothetical protein
MRPYESREPRLEHERRRASRAAPLSASTRLDALEPSSLLRLQRSVGNSAVTALVSRGGDRIIQRSPGPNAPPTAEHSSDPVEAAVEHLRPVAAAAELALDVILAEPLTADEMYELLLIRRAEPLSIPASQVNQAQARLAEIDKQIKEIDRGVERATEQLKAAREQRRRLRGSGRDVARLEVQKLQTQLKALGSEQKTLLAERVRLKRGYALGTPGRGAAAGTGQITYAVIQVVDANGRRIALESAETSATEHAEERIVGRLRATLDPAQTQGGHLIVVVDQVVCDERCKPALRAFARDFGLEAVEGRYRTRPSITGPGEATPRTTLRTATKASSAGLPVTERTEEIYRGPPSRRVAPPAPAAPDPAHAPAQPGRRPPTTPVEIPDIPAGTRMRTAMTEAGTNLLVDLVFDLLVAKYQQWRNEVNLRNRLSALQPEVETQKMLAFHAHLSDPWAGGFEGTYYNVYLRIESTTTIAIGGGHAVVIPGSPRPALYGVKISSTNMNKLISEQDAVRVFHVSEGATGAVLQDRIVQFVVYSQPVK